MDIESLKMSGLRVVELTHPAVLIANAYIMALHESTKNDAMPFNPDIIFKLLVSFEDHLKSRESTNPMPVPDFINIIYTLVEEQALTGFIISPSLREVIDKHRETMDKDPVSLSIQRMLIFIAKSA
jgi:hypothetical protein